MDELAHQSADNRAAVFRTAAAELGRPPIYVEKDFWVCWILHRLFVPPLIKGMVFKGGTSLSKVWQAIQRFSEDIDLTLPRNGVPGADRIDINDEQSVARRKILKEELDELLTTWCRNKGLETVRARIQAGLGTETRWAIESTDDSLEFEYPIGLPSAEYGQGYVKRLVRWSLA